MLQIGQTISAYQLIAHIASGGQATVYRARHTVLQREVALKVLHPHLLTVPDFVEKFAREAQLLAQLQHPNIVEVYDANRDAATGLYFIAIEFLPGTDLETLIAQQGKLAVEVVVAVAQQVASALEYAHARRLIHRDIKPSNLMLLPDGTVKVLDFGIAAIIAAGQKAKTRIGTVEYMSPEHFAGNADARSDIYSLGATLYHCLTGQLPPVIASQPPTPPRQFNPAISPALENVILKALQADPARRHQTAREFILEIESAQRAPQVAVSAPATIVCSHCGAVNRVGARYCTTCGGAIVVAPKTYAGPLKVRMGIDPIAVSKDYEPQFYWSPDGKNILLVLSDGQRAFLQLRTEKDIQNALAGHKRVRSKPLVQDVQVDSKPDWSPNGEEIAYTSAKDGKIWSFNLVTHTAKQLTSGDGVHKNPLWSPMNTALGYLNEYSTTIKRWTVVNFTGKIRLVEGEFCAGWSPNGHRFACVSGGSIAIWEQDKLTTIMIDDLYQDSWQYTKITGSKWISENQIAISNKGTTVAPPGVAIVNVEKQTKESEWVPGWPELWSPPFLIAKAIPRIVGGCLKPSDDFRSFESYLIWADMTEGIHSLPSTNSSSALCKAHDWSPDATKILFTRGKGIYVVNIDDTGLQHLTDGYDPEWSPDGKYIAFLRSPQGKVYEVWVMQVS